MFLSRTANTTNLVRDNNLKFSDIVDIVSKELARQNLAKSVELAEKYGLSTMNMDEISQEVKAVRDDAKSRN